MTADYQRLVHQYGAPCVELAMLASPACRVEPELLANLRRRLAPRLGSDAEGALWFSGLVEAYGVDGVVLGAAYRHRLWESLLRDPRADAAWKLIQERHPRISPALSVEEAVNWHAVRLEYLDLSENDRRREEEDLEKSLQPVLKAIYAGGRESGLGQWLRRALGGFHPRLMRQDILQAVTNLLRLRGEPVSRVASGAVSREFLGRYAGLFATGRKRLLRVQRSGDKVILGGGGKGGRFVQVPDVIPCELVVEWESGGRTHREAPSCPPGKPTQLTIGPGPVRIIALDGAVYDPDVPSTRDETPPPDFLGAWPVQSGTHFRVWVPWPWAKSITAFVSSGKSFPPRAHAVMQRDSAGIWSGYASPATVGDGYWYRIEEYGAAEVALELVDPQAREIAALDSPGGSSVIGVIARRSRRRPPGEFQVPRREELVIYELHLGSFTRDPGRVTGGFDSAAQRFGYLRELAINAVLLMPIHECGATNSWGFDPHHLYALASRYGGKDAFRRFVQKAHAHGLAVFLTVCVSHAAAGSPLTQFGGGADGKPGSYFVSGDPSLETPWGPRYNVAEPMVARYLSDNVLMWVEEYGIDGIRWDEIGELTDSAGRPELEAVMEAGRQFVRETNEAIHARSPDTLILGEHSRRPGRSRDSFEILGFDGFKAETFLRKVRQVLAPALDEQRDVHLLVEAVTAELGGPVRRIVCLESHDDAGQERPRLPAEIDSGNPSSEYARKRSLLGAAILLTVDGIPMLFQGQEFLEHRPFNLGSEPLDWSKRSSEAAFLRAMTDLIRLRTNRDLRTRGLTGSGTANVHLDDRAKVIAYHRYSPEHPEDRGVLVVLHCANVWREDFELTFPPTFPSSGRWEPVFHTENPDYSGSPDFRAEPVLVHPSSHEPSRLSGRIRMAPYSAAIYVWVADPSSKPAGAPLADPIPPASPRAPSRAAGKSGGKARKISPKPAARGSRAELRFQLFPGARTVELPLVIGLIADLSGKPREPLASVADRRFFNLSDQTFDALFEAARPRVALQVPCRVPPHPEYSLIAVDLQFRELADFMPDHVARRLPVTSAILEARERLQHLVDFLDGDELAGDILRESLQLGALRRPSESMTEPEVQDPSPPPGDSRDPTPQERERADRAMSTLRERMGKSFPRSASEQARLHDAILDLAREVTAPWEAGGLPQDFETGLQGRLAALDRILSDQVRVILHHPEFQELEGTWRGLKYLLSSVGAAANVRLRVLNITKAELGAALESHGSDSGSSAWRLSPIASPALAEFEVNGAEPFGCWLMNFSFDHRPEDIQFLSRLARIGAATHAPFLATAGPSILRLKDWRDLDQWPRDFAAIASQPEYNAWQRLRSSEDSRFLVLTMPRVLSRPPHATPTNHVEGFAFEEMPRVAGTAIEQVQTHVEDDLVWSSSVYALASVLVRSFVETGLCWRIWGSVGGWVKGLPVARLTGGDLEGRTVMKGPTEAFISERMQSELADLGLLSLCSYAGTDNACFLGSETVHHPSSAGDQGEAKSSAIAARLSTVLVEGRLVHYMRKMSMEAVGMQKTLEEVTMALNRWILQFTSASDSPYDVKCARPLADARVEVIESKTPPSLFEMRAHVLPHH